MECQKAKNEEQCPCAATECERHGVCCECLRAHVANKALPSCLRDLEWLEVKAD